MAFGRRKSTETTSTEPKKELPKSMGTRLRADDSRGNGHETSYQASRGGWFKPTQRG
ncbi:hypothetical protein [Streptomyces sp. NPDC056707]|uniref:hypothetical protein n=1 Tax=Streptomyces sp. NPDC056707 TaxID=3345919 RepID=UPI0036CE5463